MKGNIAGLMQQAQKMQQEMQKAQEELANMVVTGEAAGGLVKVTMTGKHAVKRVQIDPSLLDDQEMLEDIVTAAVNVVENTTAVTTVAATDADLPAQTVTYSISGGDDAALFAIDSVTGAWGGAAFSGAMAYSLLLLLILAIKTLLTPIMIIQMM